MSALRGGARRVRRRELMKLGGALALSTTIPGVLSAAVGAASCTSRARGRVPDGDLIDPGMSLGHKWRDMLRSGALASTSLSAKPAADPPILDVIIVGGGVAGLSAAWQLRKAGIEAFELIELSDVEGGTARSGTSSLANVAYPWGAHYVTAPLAEDALTTSLLHEVGALDGVDEHGHPRPAEHFACRDPDERLFVGAASSSSGDDADAPRAAKFHESLAPVDILTESDRRDFARFEALLDKYSAMVDGDGKPAFALPRARCSRDAELMALDRVSFKQWLVDNDLKSARLHWWCDYAVRDDDGVSLDQASAWAGLFYFCARRRPNVGERAVITQPDGNGFLVKHLAKSSAGKRTLNECVVNVAVSRAAAGAHAADNPELIDVVTIDNAGSVRVRRARTVIVAVPRFVAARMVQPLREAARDTASDTARWVSQFTTSAWVVANAHLRDRPRVDARLGLPFAWDTVLDGLTTSSRSLGFVDATHQTGRDHGPTVWTWYMPLVDGAHADPNAARAALYAGNREHWANACLSDLEIAFPNVRELVARVDVCRWGHAMVRPTPGLFSSGALDEAARPLANNRIHFAHTDLSGMALFEEALFHGARAADDVIAQLRGAARASSVP